MSGATMRRLILGAIRSVRATRNLHFGPPRRLQRANRLTIPATARLALGAQLQ